MISLTIYTDKLPDNVAGRTNGFVIRIKPSYRDDAGLLAHELVHVKQWWVTLGLHSLLYLLSDRYKLWAEVQAYKEQAKHYADDRKPQFAGFISSNYGLDVTPEQALKLLEAP